MQITKGDAVTLKILIRAGAEGAPADLSGASFESSYPAEGGGVLTIPNAQHSIGDQSEESEERGYVSVAFTAEDTEQLLLGRNLNFVVKVTQGPAVKHYHSSKALTVLSSSPVPAPVPASNIFIGGAI